ncbi:tail fiber domain-containing protein [Streptomyces sp. NPDC053499]|uniref:tail fiber domain-containing protein n=1 Tax=Streptomyces sp. NPDC053499 TaxID=3365707 RepID=UPI0037CDB80F
MRRARPHPAGPASGATGEMVRAGAPVNGHHVLGQVVRLPVSTWRYHWDPPHVRHIGPMAQDWWAAFEVGEDDRTICCTDANGIALVAIQALHRQVEELRSQVTALQEQAAHRQPQESDSAGPQAR